MEVGHACTQATGYNNKLLLSVVLATLHPVHLCAHVTREECLKMHKESTVKPLLGSHLREKARRLRNRGVLKFST